MTTRPSAQPGAWRVLLGWLLVLALAASGCAFLRTGAREAEDRVEIELGRELIQSYGCGTCHTIPGVRGADGLVGPPLTRFSHRAYVAGSLPNTVDDLAHWIANPKEVEPNTAMPDLGVSEEEARNMAAYLHTLK